MTVFKWFLRLFKKRYRPLYDLQLEALTGHGAEYWFNMIQQLIQDNSGAVFAKGPYAGHSLTDLKSWTVELSMALTRHIDEMPGRFDGNMRYCAAMGLITTMWYVRLHRAKAYDPNRPVDGRQQAFFSWQKHTMAIVSTINDEALDAIFFNQKWDMPFSKDAKNGEYV